MWSRWSMRCPNHPPGREFSLHHLPGLPSQKTVMQLSSILTCSPLLSLSLRIHNSGFGLSFFFSSSYRISHVAICVSWEMGQPWRMTWEWVLSYSTCVLSVPSYTWSLWISFGLVWLCYWVGQRPRLQWAVLPEHLLGVHDEVFHLHQGPGACPELWFQKVSNCPLLHASCLTLEVTFPLWAVFLIFEMFEFHFPLYVTRDCFEDYIGL